MVFAVSLPSSRSVFIPSRISVIIFSATACLVSIPPSVIIAFSALSPKTGGFLAPSVVLPSPVRTLPSGLSVPGNRYSLKDAAEPRKYVSGVTANIAMATSWKSFASLMDVLVSRP